MENIKEQEQEQYITEKNLLLRGQFELLLQKHPTFRDFPESFEIFERIWNNSEEYMIQVFRYILTEKENLTPKNTESESES
jgi:hypothetical protein